VAACTSAPARQVRRQGLPNVGKVGSRFERRPTLDVNDLQQQRSKRSVFHSDEWFLGDCVLSSSGFPPGPARSPPRRPDSIEVEVPRRAFLFRAASSGVADGRGHDSRTVSITPEDQDHVGQVMRGAGCRLAHRPPNVPRPRDLRHRLPSADLPRARLPTLGSRLILTDQLGSSRAVPSLSTAAPARYTAPGHSGPRPGCHTASSAEFVDLPVYRRCLTGPGRLAGSRTCRTRTRKSP
jgi:hypothetical protein